MGKRTKEHKKLVHDERYRKAVNRGKEFSFTFADGGHLTQITRYMSIGKLGSFGFMFKPGKRARFGNKPTRRWVRLTLKR